MIENLERLPTEPERGKRRGRGRPRKYKRLPPVALIRPPSPASFIYEHLTKMGEDYPENIHRMWKALMEQREVEAYVTPTKIIVATYQNFYRYFWWFVQMGFVKPSGREEPIMYKHLAKKLIEKGKPARRVYYKLTPLGKKNQLKFRDPIGQIHPNLRTPEKRNEYIRRWREKQAARREVYKSRAIISQSGS